MQHVKFTVLFVSKFKDAIYAVFYKITTAAFGLTPSSFYRVTADEILTTRLIKLFTKNLQVKLNCNLRLIHMPRNFTKKVIFT